ncbi:MAG: hypothetical protein IT423_06265 [Pirellulaceae bacterium]|nr:hypothetical protein [Pirellulaceae bacterium]
MDELYIPNSSPVFVAPKFASQSTRHTPATQVTLEWDAPNTTAGFTYEYFINGVKTPLTRCRGPYVFCTEADFRIVTFDLPAAGTSLRFGVAARDVDLNLSLPAELDIAN